jgi:predicted MFS family arabinose efflux permease
MVPRLVPRSALGLANGRLELARSAAFAAGPALAGALVTWAGAPWAFAVATALSVVAVGLLRHLPEPARVPIPPRHPWAELKEGTRQVWHHPLLRPVLLTAVVWNLSWFVMQAAYVPHAMRTLGLDARGVGLTLAAYGLGMVTGSLSATRVMARLPFGVVVSVGPVVSVLAAATLAASMVWPRPELATAAMFLFGAGPILWTISSVTLRQTVTPHALLGRVSAIFLAANSGARPVGALLGSAAGALAISLAGAGYPQAGEAACLLLALAGFVGQAAIILGSPVRPLTGLPAPAEPQAGR